jgi:hypothetical protein
MMKPWQTLLNKAPNKGGKGGQRKRAQVQAKVHKPKGVVQKGANEQIMFEGPH